MSHFSENQFGGYDVIRYIQKEFGCLLSPGTVYTTLYKSERSGLITSCLVSSRKRTYRVTEKGKFTLKAVSDNGYAGALIARFFKS
jgi:DNA-binding PadR family transcriptional regulator